MANPAPSPKNQATSGRPLVLVIRDGWGMNPNPEHATFDAIRVAQARGLTPVADRLMAQYPWTLIKTSGEDVGLPEGTMGNSEVGHQNIGAGRVVYQESVAITRACRAGLEKNTVIADALTRGRAGTLNTLSNAADSSTTRSGMSQAGSPAIHLMGICSDAGVHGLLSHLHALLKAASALGVEPGKVFIHLFTDGRDTGPFTGLGYVEQVEEMCRTTGVGRIASISGRYYAMDRDYRWERVKRVYDLLTGRDPAPLVFPSAAMAVQQYYDAPDNDSQKGDEFIPPRLIAGGADGKSLPPPIKNGDTVIFYNYRGDRPRELSAAFLFPDDRWAMIKASPDSGKHGFDRGQRLSLHYVIMTEYWDELVPLVRVAFPKPGRMSNIAGEHLSKLGLTQFRCAETEKYPHVTFFFNDYRDAPFPGETRENPQSPKVATYDLQPEMSAFQVRDAVLRRLAAPAEGEGRCEDFIVVNFANGDMVGHTGKLEAAVKAVATVDQCVGAIVDATLARGGNILVLADHGNCEQMFDPATNAPHTAHTLYDVPIIVVGERFRAASGRAQPMLRGDREASNWFNAAAREQRGRLADVVPTALAIMGVEKPAEMDGASLLA